jgi:hypothetical protein
MVDETRTPLAEGADAPHGDVVSCWMCGLRQHSSRMMADGGEACDDVRWYCKDPRACTERWISARGQARAGAAGAPPVAAGAGLARSVWS